MADLQVGFPESALLNQLSYAANSFSNAFPFRNHGRSTLCIYLGNVRFFAKSRFAHSFASSFSPFNFKKFA